MKWRNTYLLGTALDIVFQESRLKFVLPGTNKFAPQYKIDIYGIHKSTVNRYGLRWICRMG